MVIGAVTICSEVSQLTDKEGIIILMKKKKCDTRTKKLEWSLALVCHEYLDSHTEIILPVKVL
jgi:hypothetical protein